MYSTKNTTIDDWEFYVERHFSWKNCIQFNVKQLFPFPDGVKSHFYTFLNGFSQKKKIAWLWKIRQGENKVKIVKYVRISIFINWQCFSMNLSTYISIPDVQTVANIQERMRIFD